MNKMHLKQLNVFYDMYCQQQFCILSTNFLSHASKNKLKRIANEFMMWFHQPSTFLNFPLLLNHYLRFPEFSRIYVNNIDCDNS